MPLFVYNDFRIPIVTSFSLFFPSEVTRCGAEAAADAGYALHLSIGHIFAQLLVCGARGIVADAGKLADADVVVCLEILIERIGQLGRCERLLHLAFDLELDISQAVEQVLVGAEADAADLYILACGRCGTGMVAQLHRERAQSVELHAVSLAQGIGDGHAQSIPHKLHIGDGGRGGVVDVDGHLLDVYLLWKGYRYSRTPRLLSSGARHFVTAIQRATHYGSVPITMVHDVL